MSKTGKIAQREKQTQRHRGCPACPGKLEAVLFYPERGRPKDAFRCESCSRIFDRQNQELS